MNKPIVTYKAFDVVVVPFPFTDRSTDKRRPALVLSDSVSFNRKTGHAVMAMVTTATHSNRALDVTITDPGSAGLSFPSIVRMKLFSLDQNLILYKIGALKPKDREAVKKSVRRLLKNSL